MMRVKLGIAVVLCLCLCTSLCACGAQEQSPTEPSATVPPTEATEPTDAVQTDYWAVFRAAERELQKQSDLTLTFSYSLKRSLCGETYTETSTGTAAYASYGTDDMTALVRQSLSFGGYEAEYFTSYLSGQGYCRVDNCNFVCDMTADAFIASQLPSVLLDVKNYAVCEPQLTENGTTLTFSGAKQLETWAENSSGHTLTDAFGTAQLDAQGRLTATSYHSEYSCAGTAYVLDVTMQIDTDSAPDFSGQPVYPSQCAIINDLQIPRLMLRVVGDLFSTENMSVTYSDTLYSELYSMIRSQERSCNTYGSGSDLMTSISSQVSVINRQGTEINTQTVSFANGQASYTTNAGEPVISEGTTGEDMRIYCEDAVLTALFSLSSISEAKLVEEGDFLYIEFTGTPEYADGICANIFSLLGFNLDQYAQSYETVTAGGYLTLNRCTGLTTAMGQYLERVHTIDDVPYRLTYQLDQALQLPSQTAYETLTGQAAPETVPQQPATPLLYHVSGENGQEMWLLGTVHVGDERTGYLPNQILAAFSSSDALAVEYDLRAFNNALSGDSALQSQVSQAYYYADGSTTLSHLDEKTADRLAMMMRICGSNNINGPFWKVAIWTSLLEEFYLKQTYALDTGKSMDARLLEWAANQNKPVYEIESGLAQLQLLTGFSDTVQQFQLEAVLDGGLWGYYGDTLELYTLWCSGNEEALTAYFAKDTSEMTDEELALWQEYFKATYTDRNKAMRKTAKGYLESGETVFFAVDIANLLGEDGLVELLRDAGYTVTPVEYE